MSFAKPGKFSATFYLNTFSTLSSIYILYFRDADDIKVRIFVIVSHAPVHFFFQFI